jgi:hypothetical protein
MPPKKHKRDSQDTSGPAETPPPSKRSRVNSGEEASPFKKLSDQPWKKPLVSLFDPVIFKYPYNRVEIVHPHAYELFGEIEVVNAFA